MASAFTPFSPTLCWQCGPNVSTADAAPRRGPVAMAEEAENQAPADAERRPSALDKLKKASHLAAIVSTVASSVHKAGPATVAG